MRFGSNIGWRSPPSVHQVERRPQERERGRGEEARKAELVPEQIDDGESAPWPDDPWRLREPGERGGAVDRLLEPTQRVDHAERLGLAPEKTRPSANRRTSARSSLRPSATAAMNCPWTSSSSAWRIRRSSAVMGRAKLPTSLNSPALTTTYSTPTFFMSALRFAICITTPMDPVSVPGLA